jgi:hypothetical protein
MTIHQNRCGLPENHIGNLQILLVDFLWSFNIFESIRNTPVALMDDFWWVIIVYSNITFELCIFWDRFETNQIICWIFISISILTWQLFWESCWMCWVLIYCVRICKVPQISRWFRICNRKFREINIWYSWLKRTTFHP